MQTKALADFVCALRWEDLSPEAVAVAKLCVQDLLGAAMAGAALPQAEIWARYFLRGEASPAATAWNADRTRDGVLSTAAYNAACAHLLDVDDVHNASIVHLGAVTIPAALALGEARHCSGREVLLAIAAGYEVGARVGEAINPAAYHFWHTTGVAGPFCAAAAAGRLLGLPPEPMLHALGSAGTQAAGLWEFLADGAMSKALHTANATLCGMRAAELAGLGLTAASRILEGERGFVLAHSPSPRMDRLTEGLGSGPLKLMSNSFKPYACCRHIHSAIHAAQQLRAQPDFSLEGIELIRDRTYQVAIDCAGNPDPQTPYAHKFSIEYCLAAALTRERLFEPAFSAQSTGDPRVRALMELVRVEPDPELDAAYRQDSTQWGHTVEILYRDGRVLAATVLYPPGDFRNPLDQAAADEKFYALLDGVIPLPAARELAGRLRVFDELEDVGELFGEKKRS